MPSTPHPSPSDPAPPSDRVREAWAASAAYTDFLDQSLQNPTTTSIVGVDVSVMIQALHQALLAVLDHEPHHLEACIHPSDLAQPIQQTLPLTSELFEAIAEDEQEQWPPRVARWRAQFKGGHDQRHHAFHGLRTSALYHLLRAGAWQEAEAISQDLPEVFTEPKLGPAFEMSRTEQMLSRSLGTPCQQSAWAAYTQKINEGPHLVRVLNALQTAMDQGQALPLEAIQVHWSQGRQALLIVQALLTDHPQVALALWTPAHPRLALSLYTQGSRKSPAPVSLTKLIARIQHNGYPTALVQQMNAPDAPEWGAVDQWLLHQDRASHLAERTATTRPVRRRS